MKCKNCGSNIETAKCIYCGTFNEEKGILSAVEEIKDTVNRIDKKTRFNNKGEKINFFTKIMKYIILGTIVIFVLIFLLGFISVISSSRSPSTYTEYKKEIVNFNKDEYKDIDNLRDLILAARGYGSFGSIANDKVPKVADFEITNAIVADSDKQYSLDTDEWIGGKSVSGYIYTTGDKDIVVTLKLTKNWKQMDKVEVKGKTLTKFTLTNYFPNDEIIINIRTANEYGTIDSGKIYIFNSEFVK